MPNNLMFNNVANDLKTQIYAQSGTDVLPVQTDANGALLVLGTVTVTSASVEITGGTVTVSGGSITVVGGTVTVQGSVTVDGGTITVAGGSITVIGGTVTVQGAVTVDGGTVTVAGGTITVVGGTITALTYVSFTETSSVIEITSPATVSALTFDTSQQRMYTYYLSNQTANTATAWLQISPVTSETYFVDDQSGHQTLPANGVLVLAPKLFLKYTRLMIQETLGNTTVIAYFNTQA